jgi:sugar lactone lactonase YvrE
MTLDAEGMLWVAHWEGSRVTRWDPQSGRLLETVDLPVERVTSCTFGGPQLATLFITTASHGLQPDALVDQPLAGGLFAVQPGVTGRPANLYAG